MEMLPVAAVASARHRPVHGTGPTAGDQRAETPYLGLICGAHLEPDLAVAQTLQHPGAQQPVGGLAFPWTRMVRSSMDKTSVGPGLTNGRVSHTRTRFRSYKLVS